MTTLFSCPKEENMSGDEKSIERALDYPAQDLELVLTIKLWYLLQTDPRPDLCDPVDELACTFPVSKYRL
jgi:hypothetical protein